MVALLSMFLPILEKGYDAVIVQLSSLIRKSEEFSMREAGLALLSLLLAIPSIVMGVLGINADAGELGESVMDATVEIGDNVVDILLDDVMTGVSDAASNLFWTTRQGAAEKMRKRGYKSTSVGHSDDDSEELTPFEMLTLNTMVKKIQRQYRRRKGISLELPSEQSRSGSTATAGMESDRLPPYDHVGVALPTHEIPTYDVDLSTAHLEARLCADAACIESNEPPVTRVMGGARRRHKVQSVLGAQEPSHHSLSEQGCRVSDTCAMTRVRSAHRLQTCEGSVAVAPAMARVIRRASSHLDATRRPQTCEGSTSKSDVAVAPAMARVIRRASSHLDATRQPQTFAESTSKSDVAVAPAMARVIRRASSHFDATRQPQTFAESTSKSDGLVDVPVVCTVVVAAAAPTTQPSHCSPSEQSLSAAVAPPAMARVIRRASSHFDATRRPQTCEGSTSKSDGLVDMAMARVHRRRDRRATSWDDTAALTLAPLDCPSSKQNPTGTGTASLVAAQSPGALSMARVVRRASSQVSVAHRPHAYEGSSHSTSYKRTMARVRSASQLQTCQGVHRLQTGEAGSSNSDALKAAAVKPLAPAVAPTPAAAPARATSDQPQEEGTKGERQVWDAVGPTAMSRVQLRRRAPPLRAHPKMSTVQRISDHPGQVLEVQELERRTTMVTRRTTTIRQLTEHGSEEMTEETTEETETTAVKQERRMSTQTR